ncbi:acyl-CoA thioester hydrolase [Caulobacter ginsengisoli]|uniref:Acyl-CoA thioester hydrolase n=1 Tax=Caulobacter ginsengisoli TaxID=400775 RepID=A0ABU0IZ80_9CAUL|nr:thioesterase family protein [Caulobacter ginsengisoli]MDQ0466277.1 acyl-CoA thioester hydrolase [Caulobacter ginsengisoli]
MTTWPGVEVWRGGVNTWECDEMGHMNVRFYGVAAMQGLAGLAAELGMPQAFAADAGATLMVREQHIRFMREARAGAALYMTAGVVEMGKDEARLLLLLVHADTGALAASFQIVVAHVTARDARPFPWPARTRERAAALTVAVPKEAQARGLSLDPVRSRASVARADELDLTRIGLGAFAPQDCDVFGRAGAEQFIGKVSDGVGTLVHGFRATVVEHAPPTSGEIGGAVVEYRLLYLDWPRAGARFDIRSGLVGANDKVMRMVHWMLDPQSGRPWGVSEVVAVTFDLQTRKVIPITEAAHAVLMGQAKVGLAL